MHCFHWSKDDINEGGTVYVLAGLDGAGGDAHATADREVGATVLHYFSHLISVSRFENAILSKKRGSGMRQNRQQRAFVLIAFLAIAVALLFLLVPHGPTGNAADFVAILPLLLVGIISPLTLLSPLAYAYAGRVPQAPVLAPSFQRPPPSRRG
jgi:hypothetical protein